MWTSAKILVFSILALTLLVPGRTFAGDAELSALIDEALNNNPDILASQAKLEAAGYRITTAKRLPDPMVMIGYQNEGLRKYTYGMEPDAQWMFSASQEFPFPGKLALRGSMAESDKESLVAMHEFLKQKISAKVKELYYELFLAYKNIDLLK